MGGFVSPIFEPGPVAAPGSVFRAIPQTGVLTANDDTLFGGALMDGTVSGGDGVDLFSVNYSNFTGHVEINANFGLIYIYDFVGANTNIVSFWDFERFDLTGGAMNDTIEGGIAGNSTLRGNGGDDALRVWAGSNAVFAGSGDDTIYGAMLTDTVVGGAGNDLLIFDLSTATAGVDLGAGFNAPNWSGIERFAGTLTPHDDTLRGGLLQAEANGGAGIDALWLDYSGLDVRNPGASVSFTAFGETFAYVQLDGLGDFPETYFVSNFEKYHLRGTAMGDSVSGGSGNDLFAGLAGNDTLLGGGGRDTLRGGDGNDSITGNLDAGSEMSGGAGDDTIKAWRGDDTISGGTGFDRLDLDLWDYDTRVTIDLIAGVPGWTGVEAVSGFLTALNDTFRARTLSDFIDGGQGTDLLAFDYANSGATSVNFSYGFLDVVGNDGSSFVSATSFERFDLRGSMGNDSLTGDNRADTLHGAGGDDRLDGAGSNDMLTGAAGDDTLFGGSGADTMDGGAGRDTLVGGDGRDVLTGGAGRDTFYFWGPSTGNDRITDFEAGVDRIVIDPVFEMVPVTQSGADVLIDIMGQTIRVQGATTTEVEQAIVYDYLFLI